MMMENNNSVQYGSHYNKAGIIKPTEEQLRLKRELVLKAIDAVGSNSQKIAEYLRKNA